MKTLLELKKEIVANAELREAWSEALKSGKTDEFLKAHGCDATKEELKDFLENDKSELADEELDNVAGGVATQRGTFFCKWCDTELPLSKQSDKDPDSCKDCYNRYVDSHGDSDDIPFVPNRSFKQK